MTSNENMLNYICSMTSITKRKILKRVCKIITMVISKLKNDVLFLFSSVFLHFSEFLAYSFSIGVYASYYLKNIMKTTQL